MKAQNESCQEVIALQKMSKPRLADFAFSPDDHAMILKLM